MSTELVPFSYSNTPVRVVVIEGEPWFVLADLCKVLAISDVSIVRRRLDDALCQTHPIADSLGRTQQATVVSEAGMYEVVIRSDKPEAVDFRRWLTGEVLPQIRKTGSYNPEPARPAIDGNSITRMELIQIAMNAETERLALEAANQVLTPKAEAYDSFIDATGHYAIGAVAKMLGRSRPQMFRDLRNNGILIAKGSMRNTPYQQFMKHFVVKAHEFTHSNGDVGTSYTTYVQPGGIDFIRRRLGLAAIDPIPGGDA